MTTSQQRAKSSRRYLALCAVMFVFGAYHLAVALHDRATTVTHSAAVVDCHGEQPTAKLSAQCDIAVDTDHGEVPGTATILAASEGSTVQVGVRDDRYTGLHQVGGGDWWGGVVASVAFVIAPCLGLTMIALERRRRARTQQPPGPVTPPGG